eukprot:scaffold49413_cov21-Tisochrysis_lutea.AAC.1
MERWKKGMSRDWKPLLETLRCSGQLCFAVLHYSNLELLAFRLGSLESPLTTASLLTGTAPGKFALCLSNWPTMPCV